MNSRLDEQIVTRGLAGTRNQAQNLVKLGKVRVDGRLTLKPAQAVAASNRIEIDQGDQYVSRAGYKLAGANSVFKLDFKAKTVLDVGSSTGGFTDYALKNGAAKVIAVDVGTDQLHPSLHGDTRIELHEKTDIRHIGLRIKDLGFSEAAKQKVSIEQPDIVVIDVSFISMREVLPHIAKLAGKTTVIVAMVKPQFEAGKAQTNKGVIKNDTIRRQIFKDFEFWAKSNFIILGKSDSEVSGAKGNLERFYLLKTKS